MIKTEYRLIPDFPGYRVGSDGSVWSQRALGPSKEWRLLHGAVNCDGYRDVTLCRGLLRRHFFIHRLVLTAFVGPCPEGMECRHLDGDPANNCLNNLCWGTPKSNKADSILHGTRKLFFGSNNGRAKLSEDTVRNIRRMYALGHHTYQSLSNHYGVSERTIYSILARKTWNHILT